MNLNDTEFALPDECLGLETDIFLKAREGDSFAQLDIGKAYYDAPHVKDNLIRAFEWITLAAEQQNMEAQFKLGDLYAFGQGVEKHEFTAYDWYLKSAIQGYPKALTRIHNLYHIETSMHCRGKRDAGEDEWATAEFKNKNKIRELNEYRIEQIKPKLTNIKEYFSELLIECRQKVKKVKQDKIVAYTILGFLYQHGYEVRKITSTAIEFYRLAAEQGSTDSAFNLGFIYHHHINLKWNYREAFKWYTIAAQNGNSSGQNGLAHLYLKGLGTNTSYSEALGWYKKAASSRDINAMISLASIFRKDDIVKQDYRQAREWYIKAIKEGSTVAQNSLESLYSANPLSDPDTPHMYSKKGLCSKLHSDVSNIPEVDGLEELRQSASHCMRGDGHAMLDIGKRYLQGNRFPQDKHVGFKWIRNAAKTGLNEARCALAQMYKNGDCIDQDYHKASIWYMKAAKSGDAKAQCEIGLMYHHGLGVRKDPLEASKWYTFAADKNNSDAQCQLGILRERGEGLSQDTAEAAKLYRESIKQRNPYSIHKLAQMYEDGSENNFKVALRLLKIAARFGNVDAQLKLGKTYGNNRQPHYHDPTKSFEYYQMASDQGSPEAKYKLAAMYLGEQGIDQNLVQAYYLFKESSRLGYGNAINIFNVPIEFWKSDDIDYRRVSEMFVTVCEKEIDSLEYNLGYFYSQDSIINWDNFFTVISADATLERTWYEKAADKGNPLALYKLGIFFESKDNQAETQDHLKALDYFQKAHAFGNTDATYKLATLYLHGNGTSQDLNKAFSLLNEASDKGHKEAYKTLNDLNMDDVADKYQTIKKMLEMSAESGNVISQYNLGTLTSDTKSPHYNIKDGIKWLKLASDGGFINAHYKLGLLLESDSPSEKEHQNIISLYQMAADKGHVQALFRMAQLYHNRTKSDYLEAFRLYTLAAQQGYPPAQLAAYVSSEQMWEYLKNQLPDNVTTGQLDYISCFRMWEHAADQGNVELQYNLGLMYEETSLDSALSKAVKWYSRAAGCSHSLALYHLGGLYEGGRGINQNYLEAIKCYKMAGHLSNSEALYQLGTIYHQGRGAEVDAKEAIHYYTQAAEKGHAMAQFTLGRLFEDGTLLSKSILKAVECYSISHSQGNEKAQKWLHDYYDKPYKSNSFYGRQLHILSQIIDINNYRDQYQNSELLGSVNYKLGMMYFYGYGTKLDYKKALECFRESTKLSANDITRFFSEIVYQDISASVTEEYLKKVEMFETAVELLELEDIYELGSIYYHGVNSISEDINRNETQFVINSDHVKSSRYFKMIVKTQLPVDELYTTSSYYLGVIHYFDYRLGYDTGKAHYYLTKASHRGYADAKALLNLLNDIDNMETDGASTLKRVFEWLLENHDSQRVIVTFNIGLMYLKGTGTDQDYKKAFYYIEDAAGRDHIEAKVILGQFYENGRGTEQNYSKALEWYTKAANQNSMHANYYLGEMYMIGKGVEVNYRLAFNYLKASSTQGFSFAQTLLGHLYYFGYGVDQSYVKAMEWYTKAAAQNETGAIHKLGLLYNEGKGVQIDYKRAFQYFQVAADKGLDTAQNSLAMMYSSGQGVELNYIKSAEWHTKAANQNNISSIFNLGTMYYSGKGVEVDYTKAIYYFELAANQGDINAQLRLGDMYIDGDTVDQDYIKAIDWYTKAASQNSASARCTLGHLYFSGEGVEVNYRLAFQYHQAAANQGDSGSQVYLGIMYSEGYGCDQDYTKALYWYTKAASQNNIIAIFSLGVMFFEGKGVEVDYKRAAQYNELAANQGYVKSQRLLALLYMDGYGVDQDAVKSIEWLTKAADQNDGISSYSLGNIYFYGTGVEVDYKLAFRWYQTAADQGYTDSYIQLADMLRRGLGVEKNIGEAKDLYVKVPNKDGKIWCVLGEMYHSAENQFQDFSKAFECYKQTEGVNKSYALRGLGLLYEHGEGVEKDYKKAFEYYKLSEYRGNKGAYYNVALLYYNGKGVSQDFVAAFELFERTVEDNLGGSNRHVLVEDGPGSDAQFRQRKQYSLVPQSMIYGEAHFYLGVMNEKGQGTPQNHQQALNHFKTSHSYGNEKAKRFIGLL